MTSPAPLDDDPEVQADIEFLRKVFHPYKHLLAPGLLDRRDVRGREVRLRLARNPQPVEIRTGMILELGERNYMGKGSLALKVGPVPPHRRRLPTSLEWVVLAGRVVGPNGVGKPCTVCVRVSAIPEARRAEGWRPAA